MRFKRKVISSVVCALCICSLVGCKKVKVAKLDPEEDSKSAKKYELEVLDVDLTDEEYAFGVNKDQKRLLGIVNSYIKKIKKNGALDDICDRYFGDGEPIEIESAKLDEDKDQLVVATNASFEPFEYMSGSKYMGIDMEIAKNIADELHMELVIVNMEFSEVCNAVSANNCDIAMSGLTITEDREDLVTFSEPYYKASQRLVMRKGDDEFDDLEDALAVSKKLHTFDDDIKIGVQNGTTGKLFCKGDNELNYRPMKATIVSYSSAKHALEDLSRGKLNYVIIDSAPAEIISDMINGDD